MQIYGYDEFLVFYKGLSTYNYQIYQSWLNSFDLKYVRLHDFRHNHASYLINNGGADCIVAVSKRLGYSSVEMTLKRYTHLLPSAEKSSLEILENNDKSELYT